MQTGLALLLSLILASATAEDVQRVVDDTYDGGGYQTGHPAGGNPFAELPEIPEALIVVLKALMWTALAVLALVVVTAVVRRLRARDVRDPRDRKAPPATAPPTLDAPLGDAEALAAAGRYEEAIHVLLLRTIQTLARHQRIPVSLTSRELLGRLELGPAPREALARLVEVVEVSHFGGRDADRGAYERSVAAFDALRGTLAGGTA